MMDGKIRIEIYEFQGQETNTDKFVHVEAHDDNDNLIVLSGDGIDGTIAVSHDELGRAVQAAKLIAESR